MAPTVTDKGMLTLGPAIAFANQIQPLKEIVEGLLADATAAFSRLQSLSSRQAVR